MTSLMATHSLQSLHHSSLLKLQQHHPSDPTTPPPPSTLFLKPTPNTTSLSVSSSPSSSIAAFSISPSTSTSPSTASETFSLDLLREHLSNKDFFKADEETRRLVILLAGEAAQKRGYVFFSEVQFISENDLKAIDELWREYSDNKFGYSVQKRIWQEKAKKDFTKFFLKVGWMKKLDTEVEQYNYRAFPNEFMWELNEETPEGHLPLTNALRGTQLLNCILSHPAFEAEEEEEQVEPINSSKQEDNKKVDANNGGLKGLMDGSKPLSKTIFKPDYSF